MSRVTRSQANSQHKSSNNTDFTSIKSHLSTKKRKAAPPIPIRPAKDSYTSGTFEAIPTSILRIIHQYLTHYDYLQFLNTNVAIFQHSKHETVYYNFTCQTLYLKSECNKEVDYFQKLCSFVQDKSKQISLNCIGYNPYFIQHCSHLITGIHALTIKSNRDFWNKHPDLGLFSNIYHIQLHDVDGIECLTGLKGITILEVKQSESLLTIDLIPGLKRLILHDLPNLQQISQYGNIPELSISRCRDLSFDGLGNHTKVFIKPCMSQTIDISIFRDIQYLEYEERNVFMISSKLSIFPNLIYLVFHGNKEFFDPLSFPSLQFLKLTSAKIDPEIMFPSSLQAAEFHYCLFDDLSVVRHVKKLKFATCYGIGFRNAYVLSNARQLIFNDIKELFDISGLDEVYELRIESCVNVKDVSKLGQVHRLCLDHSGVENLKGLGQGNSEVQLSGLFDKVDLSPLRSIYKVILTNCSNLEHGKDLVNVQHLSIIQCDSFKNTSALGKVKSLYLAECNGIRKLVGLENVPHINLTFCNRLENIDCLGKQQSLIIYNCRKLQQVIQGDDTGKFEQLFSEIPFVRIDVAEDEVDVLKDLFPKSLLPPMFDE